MATAAYITASELRGIADTMDALYELKKQHLIRFGPLPVRDSEGLALGRIITPRYYYERPQFVPAK